MLEPKAFAADSNEFTERLEDRKRDARKLAHRIETAALNDRLAFHEDLLAKIRDSYSYRLKCSISAGVSAAGPATTRKVTVALVTSDLRRPHAAKCLSLLKRHTSDFDLLILDNNGSRQFNHPREMNKVLRTAKTDYVVLLDDDVYVTPGWLEGLIECIGERTGIVTPLHRDRQGRISYSGVYLNGDGQGTHAHTRDVPASPRPCQCMCSAAVLIDRRKCGNIFFNDAYQKYFLDLDYALQVWEAGYEVLCTPRSIVTHLGGATMAYTTAESTAKGLVDRNTFGSIWVATGRLGRVESEIWSGDDYLRGLVKYLQRLQQIFDQAGGRSPEELRRVLMPLIDELRPMQLILPLAGAADPGAGIPLPRAGGKRPGRLLTGHGRRTLPAAHAVGAPLAAAAATVVKPVIAQAKSLAYQRLPVAIRRYATPRRTC